MNNGKPISQRKAVQFMVILTLLAWATQTLFHQWGFGQEAPSTPASASLEPGEEKWTNSPAPSRSMVGGTLVLRSEATVSSGEVKLKNVCRWSDADAAVFASLADLTISHVSAGRAYKSVTTADVRITLRDAGMNLGLIRISGATTCAVNRSDVQVDEHAALQEWIAAQNPSDTTDPTGDPAASPSDPARTPLAVSPHLDTPAAQAGLNAVATPVAANEKTSPFHSLRDLLAADLCTRLQVDTGAVQMSFNPADDRVLNLVEPYFKFNITPRRVRDLGEVMWDVTIVANGSSQNATITASARAWQTQVLLNKPLSYRQVIRDDDLVEKRTLVDRLPDQPLLTRLQAVGQQAARELKPGTLLTGNLVDPVMLANPGQLITVKVSQGNVHITTVARAIDAGAFGQSIRVRTEADPPQTYEVTLTAPQEGSVASNNSQSPVK